MQQPQSTTQTPGHRIALREVFDLSAGRGRPSWVSLVRINPWQDPDLLEVLVRPVDGGRAFRTVIDRTASYPLAVAG